MDDEIYSGDVSGADGAVNLNLTVMAHSLWPLEVSFIVLQSVVKEIVLLIVFLFVS